MKSIFYLVTLAATVLAVPTPTCQWTPELGSFLSAVSRRIQDARNGKDLVPPTCDMSKAQMPVAPSPLPSPTGTLKTVVLGRGVQNYTCATPNSPSVTPVAIGAIANLYDVSCVAANYEDIMDMMPNLALQYPLPQRNKGPLQPTNLMQTGHHYFNASGIPTFDLNDSPNKMGVVQAKVANKTPAPATASKGQGGKGDGAVPWLLLNVLPDGGTNMKQVYRVNTAGGQPPANCGNSPAAFSVEYATEYWFYE